MQRGQVSHEWVALQRKIFSRWVRQKLSKRHIEVDDVVNQISDGVLLVNLMEVLSETPYTGKPLKPTNQRVQKIDNVNNALAFVWSCGVQMKAKPQAEGLVDGNETAILGLIWAIMLRYLKIGDEEGGETLNAKDALLLWAQNKTAGYAGVDLKNFNSFRDGLALCAIIHKHRPNLINYESLSKDDKLGNLEKAIEAAHRYFNLEKYLSPTDITKLDENSMVVYVSEYYHGIAEQRKLDLAAKRIGKVIKLTEENDAMKAEYNKVSAEFKERLQKVQAVLGDRTIDNTMAGAKHRIELFYKYKAEDKSVLLGDQLTLEGLYNNLAMRLAYNRRPDFIPPAGLSLKDISAAMKELEEHEQLRKVALHAELNRQIRLVQVDEQHKKRFAKIHSWVQEKEAYLRHEEVIDTVSGAQLQLRLLDAYDKEQAAVHGGTVALLKQLGAELQHEKYERSDEVRARESDVNQSFERLSNLSKAKRPVLDDALAREQYREKTYIKNQQHINAFERLVAWYTDRAEYLQKKEHIDSVSEANTQLSLLEAFDGELQRKQHNDVAALNALGAEILARKHESQYSKWSIENPHEITDRQAQIEHKWHELAQLSAAKREVLEADLARELEKERLRIEFSCLAGDYVRWTKETAEDTSATNFGFDLPEVEAFKATLDANNQSITEESNRRKGEAVAIHQQGEALGVRENVYTKLTLADLDHAAESLHHALAERNAAYAKELARQQANDALCKQFAELVEPLSQWIVHQKDTITQSKAELDEQLQYVNERIEKADADGSSLSAIAELEQKIVDAGVTNNRHTNLTHKDADVQFVQYRGFLGKKQKMLENEIEQHKLRGVTAEQLKEIEDNIVQYDSGSKGHLDKKEFKACLYSLGEEKTRNEVDQLIKEHGNGEQGVISHEAFRQYMISVLGVSDTKEDILAGFELINRGHPVGKVELMELVLSPHDLEYIKRTAPAVEGGYDYKAWTEDVFSR